VSELASEIVRAAVNLARAYQIRSVRTLRTRLETHYPGAKEEIDEALAFWAEQARRWR
jgi:hypothetical protein